MLKKYLVSILCCLILFLTINCVSAKDLIFPHVVINDTWDAGIALVNISDNDSAGNVFIYSDGGFITDSYRILIPAHNRYYLFLNNNGIFSIVIKGCHDDVYGTFIRIWDGYPVGEVNAIEIYH